MTDPSSASTPTPQPLDSAEFKSLVLAERATHAARGYTVEHDREHGVTHLAKWATDYARRGEAVKAASLIAALADAHAAEVEALRTERDGLEESLEHVEAGHEALRTERDGLAAAIEQAPHADSCDSLSFRPRPCDCWKSDAAIREGRS